MNTCEKLYPDLETAPGAKLLEILDAVGTGAATTDESEWGPEAMTAIRTFLIAMRAANRLP